MIPPPESSIRKEEEEKNDGAALLRAGASAQATTEALPISELEQLLRDYHQRVEVENESRGEWFWLDEIEDRIGRERYFEIMRQCLTLDVVLERSAQILHQFAG